MGLTDRRRSPDGTAAGRADDPESLPDERGAPGDHAPRGVQAPPAAPATGGRYTPRDRDAPAPPASTTGGENAATEGDAAERTSVPPAATHRITPDRTPGDQPTARQPVTIDTQRTSAAVVALVLGVIATLLAIVPIVGVIGSLLGVIAIGAGVIGLFAARKPTVTGGGMALAGVLLGALALVLGAVGLVVFSDTAADLQQPIGDAVDDVTDQLRGVGD